MAAAKSVKEVFGWVPHGILWNSRIWASLPHPATSGPPVLDTAIFSLSQPTTLWALAQAAEGPSMSASPWMCLCVPRWLVYGVIPEDQRLGSHPILWASLGLNQSSVKSRPGRELGSDLALESTMWAVALDLTELESSINRKQKNMNQHLCIQVLNILGFPGSSAGRESACNAGDPRLIPGSGRSAGEGIGYPLQYSWASLVAQLVKNLQAM